MNKKIGFTLAEVLITLGIIGVVAMLTIPTLLSSINATKFRVQYKKTLSTLNQSGRMAKAHWGIEWNSINWVCDTESNGYSTEKLSEDMNRVTACAILNSTLTGYTATTKSPYGATPTFSDEMKYHANAASVLDETMTVKYMLADGSLVVIPAEMNDHSGGGLDWCTLQYGQSMGADWFNDTSGIRKAMCVGFIDVNGSAPPNKEVTCSDSLNDYGEADSAKFDPEHACVVAPDKEHMTDIYPIVFHDGTVEPATDAARAVLISTKIRL